MDSRAAFTIADVDLYLRVQDSTQQNLAAFDCDPLRAGIYPVWISWDNRSSRTLDFSNAEIRMEMPSGRQVKILSPAELVERLYRSYSIRLYSTYYRQVLEGHFNSMSMLRMQLQPGHSVQGFLFAYIKPPSQEGLRGARLHWTGIRELEGSKLHSVRHVFSSK